MKKLLYIIFVSLLFFVSFVTLDDSSNPVGTAIQIWIPLIFVLVTPLLFTISLGIRITIFIPLAGILSVVGMRWAGYSDLGGFIYPFYCFFILIAIIVSHFVMKKISSSNASSTVSILALLVIVISIYGVFIVQSGLSKYNTLVEQFKTKCATTGSIYGHCDEPNYIRFFPPNNHVTF